MHNLVLSPIDPDRFTESIAEKVVEKMLSALKNEHQSQAIGTPEFYSRIQTAEKLHISLTTLDTYTRLGILNAVKVGNRVLYKSADLNESLSEKINNIKHKMK